MPQWNSIPVLRLMIGGGQGLVLFLLLRAATSDAWPFTNPMLFVPLVYVSLFAPLIVIAGVSNIQVSTLVRWTCAMTLLIAGLAVYAVYKFDVVPGPARDFLFSQDGVWGSLFAFLAVGLLIAHTLVTAADTDGRGVATYRSYFDFAWKHGVQIVAAGLFTVAFWLTLVLGNALFKLIKIEIIQTIISKDWFFVPATAIVVAIALHITDVRPGIVAGIRTLALNLLSWLLPLMTLIVWGFLASLPFTGLDALWATNFATALLLAVAAALIVLINAVYQDGAPENPQPRLLRFAASAAAIGLLPIAIIATYGLSLRVGQYGWTNQRVIAAACVVVALGYAVGYGWAVIRRGKWLERLELCNIVMSFAVLGVLIALFTPIADPHRISANSQVERLKSGRADVDMFDYDYLRFDAGRYGLAALEDLRASEAQLPGVTARIDLVMAKSARYETPETPTVERIQSNLRVITPDRTLPETFVKQDWSGGVDKEIWQLPLCMTANEICDVLMIDLNGDMAEEIVVLSPPQQRQTMAFTLGADGQWQLIGTFEGSLACAELRNPIEAGEVAVALPAWQDLVVNGQRFRLTPPPGEPVECQGAE